MRGYGVRCDTCGVQYWIDQKNGVLPKTIPIPEDWIILTIKNKNTYHCSFDCVETYHKTPIFEDTIETIEK